jgi:O-acetylhomoserine (thiol)-lyase
MQTDELKQFVLSQGADLVGIASAEDFEDVPGYKPKKLMPQARSVIVIGKKMLKGFVEAGRGRPVSWGCTHLNIKLDEIAYEVGNYLEERDYKSMPQFFVYQTFLSPQDEENFNSILTAPWFSYVLAAAKAGLGEIGLNHLLITPRYGPRMRLMAVITNADLVADEPLNDGLCPGTECGLCLQACPVQALSADGSIDKMKCHRQTDAHQVVLGYSSCALCIDACPVGK